MFFCFKSHVPSSLCQSFTVIEMCVTCDVKTPLSSGLSLPLGRKVGLVCEVVKAM